MSITNPLNGQWHTALQAEFNKPYMLALKDFLRTEKQQRKIIYPKSVDVFNAFKYTPLEKVRVVILGQDPYHNPGQAHGLCFSVLPGVKPPPSLVNIYKELQTDLNIKPVAHGYLKHWADQGILLLNSVLTVEQNQAGAHQGRGWETFTDRVVEVLNAQPSPIIFVLWGSYAQKKGAVLDQNRHVILKSAHPSPLSAHRGFFGSRPFSKINQLLQQWGEEPLDWLLPEHVTHELAATV